MKKARVLTLLVVLGLLAGCTLFDVTPPGPIVAPSVTVDDENTGWIHATVINVTASGYRLEWGDVGTAYGSTEVQPYLTAYEHMYQEPGRYTVTLFNECSAIISQDTVLVLSLDCHVSLQQAEGRSIVVKFFGRYGIDYSVTWGDKTAVSVTAMQGVGLLSHTYNGPGPYSIGMGETWAPSRNFFTVEVQ